MRSAPELAEAAARVEDPGAGLAALAELRTRLDALERMHVENAVRAGWSWSRVAAALGVSKQAVHKRHARRVADEIAAASSAGEGRILITGSARRAVRAARGEAAARGARLVATDHLLLGVLHDARVAAALAPVGVTLESARLLVAASALTGAPERPQISARARAVLEQSLHEALARGDDHLGVEHLALAITRESGGDGARLLERLGVTASAVAERLVSERVASK